jgi:hypothetical protein
MDAHDLIPGLVFAAGSAVLFSRAGYGPVADAAHRGRPCTDRCPHNASILALAALAIFGAGLRDRGCTRR